MTDQIVPAEYKHALALAPRLRKADLAEIAAATGGKPEDILVISMGSSPLCWTWLHNGRVMAIFGAAPFPGREGVGIPWLLAAKGAHKFPVYFLRNSRRYIDKLWDEFAYLENYIDCRNTVSIQWLSWCGFAMCEVLPFFGVQRLPFIRFAQARPS